MNYSARILFAKGTSLLGSLVFNTVLDLWVVSKFNSALVLGNVLAVSSAAAFIWSMLGGYVADTRRFLIILKATDIISAFICIISIALNLTNSFLGISSLVFLLNMNVYLAAPIFKKMVHTFVNKENILVLNQKIAITIQLFNTALPPVISTLFAAGMLSIRLALLINSISYLVSYFIIHSFSYKMSSLSGSVKKLGYINTLRNIAKDQNVLSFLILGMILNYVLAGVNVIMPIYVIQVLDEVYSYGFVLGFQAIGGLMGSFSLKKMPFSSDMKVEIIAIRILSIFFICLAIFNQIFIAYLLALILAFILSRYNVASQSYIQEKVKSDFIGKTFAIIYIFSNLATPLGNVFFGVYIHKSYKTGSYMIAVGMLLISLLWSFIFKKRKK